MRPRRKKFLYIVLLFITIQMFLHSWKMGCLENGMMEYAKNHHEKQHPIKYKQLHEGYKAIVT